jgi:transcriptional regulator with XRE-family HTH domain
MKHRASPLRIARVTRGWSQGELADRAGGLQRKTVFLTETGATTPLPRTRQAIAEALGVAESELWPHDVQKRPLTTDAPAGHAEGAAYVTEP